MTPRMLAIMRKIWLGERADLARMVAVLRTDIINFSMCRPKEPVKLSDLFSEPGKAPENPGKKRMTAKAREEIAGSWRRFMGEMTI